MTETVKPASYLSRTSITSDIINMWAGNVRCHLPAIGDCEGINTDYESCNRETSKIITNQWVGEAKKIYAKYLFEPLDATTMNGINLDLSESWNNMGSTNKEYLIKWSNIEFSTTESIFYDTSRTDNRTISSEFIIATGADIPFEIFERRRKAYPNNNRILSRKRTSLRPAAENEERARRLLQRFIGFRSFAKYVRDGFVNYKGKSGRIYQIFPGHAHTRVWKNGKRVEDLCLCIKDYGIPPSDSVIMRILMLEHSEEQFKELANVTPRRINDNVVSGGDVVFGGDVDFVDSNIRVVA